VEGFPVMSAGTGPDRRSSVGKAERLTEDFSVSKAERAARRPYCEVAATNLAVLASDPAGMPGWDQLGGAETKRATPTLPSCDVDQQASAKRVLDP